MPSLPLLEKICSKCRDTKPLSQFHKVGTRKIGFRARCKECRASDSRAYYSSEETENRRRQRDERAKMNAAGVRKCSVCGTIKPLNVGNFKPTRSRQAVPSFQHACRECVRKRVNAGFRQRYSSEEKFRSKTLSHGRKYSTGFTPYLYALALSLQNYACAICKANFSTQPSRRIHADHNHRTQSPRGILCQKCNAGLGMFEDTVERLRAAIAYLEDPPLSLLV